ncbi:MAG TPA: GNAT family N-acetyltransferase, partial [Usitatibacteraceae bacterium]|nr:GNAT family N-acetyltransferase [Usitatibacteraceae bacterium]
MKLLATERLRLRPMTADDAPFILELLNEPAWLRFIGDRNVHTLDDARAYILTGPMETYTRLGLGFSIVESKDANVPM